MPLEPSIASPDSSPETETMPMRRGLSRTVLLLAALPLLGGGQHAQAASLQLDGVDSWTLPAFAAVETQPHAIQALAHRSADVCGPELLSRIDLDRTLEQLRFLSEEIGPRVAASPQEAEAAEFLARELREAGYEVEIQEFPRTQVVAEIEVLTPSDLRFHAATGRIRETPAEQYPLLTPEGGITGRVVDCGSGACPPEVSGHIALLSQDETPAEEVIARAADAGAVAAILHGSDWRRHLAAVDPDGSAIPFVTVNLDAADAIRAGGEVEINLRVTRFETSRNVIATRPVEGRPDAPVVVFSAHFDSVEKAPGANDNGSGTMGLLELARIFADVPTEVELRFAAVGSEEVGLVGARYYVSQLPDADRERIVANFNMDMIATVGERQTALYVNTLDGDNLVSRSARIARDILGYPEDILRAPFQRGASDHVAFFEGGIPAANFIWRDPETADLEPWYHHPRDTMEHISRERYMTALRIVLLASLQVVCQDSPLLDEATAALR